MFKMSDIVLMNVTIAAEQSKALPDDKTCTEYLQQCIHISRLVLARKLDLEVFEKFFTTRFPENPLNENYCEQWLVRFSKGHEWQEGDYATRKALQAAAPDVYPTDLNAFFNRLES